MVFEIISCFGLIALVIVALAIILMLLAFKLREHDDNEE